jgi:bifunctional DNA-binding transcriptional regulator/antitoxin component of YhaV-PrlF toxin-antitoxin module
VRLVPGRRGKVTLPDEVRAELDLQPGERLLALATDPDDRPVVATDRDLLLQRRPPGYERIGWECVDKATFDDGVLRLVGVGSDQQPFRLRVALTETGSLPQVVRDRVTSSIVLSQHIALEGELGVRVTARRRAQELALRWRYRLDDGLDDSPEIRARAETALAQVRRESGLND